MNEMNSLANLSDMSSVMDDIKANWTKYLIAGIVGIAIGAIGMKMIAKK